MILFVPSKIEWLNQNGRKGYAINPFVGCKFGCTYCWSREIQRLSFPEWVRPRLKAAFQGIRLPVEIARKAPKNANILFSASTDPFQPDLKDYESVTGSILVGLSFISGGHDSQVFVLTKNGGGIVAFLPLLEGMKVGVTVTSLQPNNWEPTAPDPGERLMALKMAKRAGCSTFISIEPWLACITDPKAIIENSERYCDWWIVGSLNARMRPIYPAFYREELPRLLDWLESQGLRERVFVKRELLPP